MSVGPSSLCLATLAIAMVACNSPSTRTSQDAPSAPSAAPPVSTAATVTSAPSAAPPVSTPDRNAENGVRVVVPGQETDALSVIRTERLKAKAEGRVLVVYAGAGWCEPCKRFKNAVHSGILDATLAKTTLLTFDADRDTERLASAGYTFRFIPYVALPGADGHPSEFVEARSKGSEAWRDLLGKLEAWQRGPR
jgi:thiol-disulfide isomerase/thioredoxin